MSSVVQSGNLVPVPPEMAQEHGLHEGSRVEWARSDDGMWTLRPERSRAEIARSLLGAGRKYVQPGESGVETFMRWREEERRLDGPSGL